VQIATIKAKARKKSLHSLPKQPLAI